MPETFVVIDPGSLSTVQDLGRFGYQALGVPVSGALDTYAARAANLLVGNPQKAAVLEMTVTGLTLAVLRPTWMAVTGARAEIRLNADPQPGWQRFQVQPGDLLRIGQVDQGCRMYLSVAGGLDVPLMMGSRSTSVGAGLGGFQGRALRKGDIVHCLPPENAPDSGPSTCPRPLQPSFDSRQVLRCIPGPQDDFFPGQGAALYEHVYTVSAQADRRGIRMQGPEIEHAQDSPGRVLSEPSLPGNIQVPGDGQPIVLLVEQTVGGYAKIATVISCDLDALAQAVPGTEIQFQPVTLDQAHQALRAREKALAALV